LKNESRRHARLCAQTRVALEALQAQAGRGSAGGGAAAQPPPRLAMHASLVLATLCALWFCKHEVVSSISRKIVSSVIFPVRACAAPSQDVQVESLTGKLKGSTGVCTFASQFAARQVALCAMHSV
jgi:hypothetical protein